MMEVDATGAGEAPHLTPAKRQAGEASQQDGGGAAEVRQFLTGIGLARYIEKLLARGYDSMEAIDGMDAQNMRDAGMLTGHVRLLQRHLTSRRASQPKGAPAAQAAEPPAPTAAAAEPAATTAAAPQPAAPFPAGDGGGLAGAGAGLQAAAPAAEAEPPAGDQQLLSIVPAVLSRPPSAEPSSKPVLPQISDLLERAKAEFREQRVAAGTDVLAGGGLESAQPQRSPSSVQKEAEVRYMAALQAARAATVAEPDPAGPDDTLMALAQLAEESAQLVATAASFCAWPQADPRQLVAVVDSAQQAAQRAQWASVAAVACGDSPDHDKEWSLKMRRAAVKAAEVAEQFARDCVKAATSTGGPQVVRLKQAPAQAPVASTASI